MEQRAKVRYGSMNAVFVFCFGMVDDDDYTRPGSKLSALAIKSLTGGRNMQTRAIPSMEVRFIREARKGTA